MPKVFDLENEISLYKCKVLISNKFSEPVVSEIIEETNYIHINITYVEEARPQLINFIRNYKKGSISILSASLINDDILHSIAANERIMGVTLGSKEDIYILTRAAFDILDKSESIYYIDTESVEGEYTSRERERISFFSKWLVDIYTYEMLRDGCILNFVRPLSENEIKNLVKYSQKGLRIYFRYNDIANIIEVIESLKGRNIEFKFMDAELLRQNIEMFKKYQDENITIDRSVKIETFLRTEEILDYFVKDIKNSTLSPYEKYLAVYKIVKDFKQYRKEGSEYQCNTALSYSLYEILFSDYIICRGFSELLIALLKRVGINATFFHVEILKPKERLTIEDLATLTKEEQKIKEGTKDYHSRIIFRLIDSKYDIDGIYISDVTWDQEEGLDLYNHSSLTPYETRFEKDGFYNTPDDIFDIQSGTEFYIKLEKVPESIDSFLNIIKQIDNNFYNYLEDNYGVEGPYTTEFFIEIYNYIIMHTNRGISKETLFKALKEIIKFTYLNLSDEKLKRIITDLEEKYDEEQYYSFIGKR